MIEETEAPAESVLGDFGAAALSNAVCPAEYGGGIDDWEGGLAAGAEETGAFPLSPMAGSGASSPARTLALKKYPIQDNTLSRR